MIAADKHTHALSALHRVLVLARSQASEGRSSDVAAVLDTTEYLVVLMMKPEDQTRAFREHLADLAHRHQEFASALECFDGTA
ncbi:hypothetical protein [Hyalangium gracile]|uniref:hypothetical protein n=1 Tax=Hyalangium gracile TaxID=394092 RepID=UPI001CCD064B|nr:hypothetical protein [Hyalangium gracile]